MARQSAPPRLRRLAAAALGAALLALPAPPGAGARADDADAPSPLAVGDALPALTLPDAHGETHAIDGSVRWILFSRDMDGGAAVRGLLTEERLGEPPPAFLERMDAVAAADVHRMPGLVRRFIAKPRMRDRPYPLLLDESGEPTERWPSAEGRATLIGLDGLRITSVTHAADAEELARALGVAPREADEADAEGSETAPGGAE